MKILYLLILLFLSQISNANISLLEFNSFFEKGQVLQTTLYRYDLEGGVIGPFNKKWKVGRKGNQIILNELLSTTMKIDVSKKQIIAQKDKMIILEKISVDPFMFSAQSIRKESYSVRKISAEVLAFDFSETKYTLIFKKSQDSSPDLLSKSIDSDLGIWTAPFGPNSFELVKLMQSFADFEIYQEKSKAYLHHDFSIRKRVFVSEKFPKKFLKTLRSTLSKWNSALPSPIFDMTIHSNYPSLAFCFSMNVLCVDWQGSENFAWTGYSAVGLPTYDPQTGTIIGGLIVISNNSVVKENNFIDFNRLNKFDVAQMVLDREKFIEVDRPNDAELLEALLLHEIGHYNGFAHDHHGTNHGDLENPSNTVMAYLPFPIIHRMTELGRQDIKKLNLIYQGRSNQRPDKTCNDFQSIPRKMDEIYVKPNPRCNQYTLGNPLDWYVLLASVGAQGALTQIPFNFILPFAAPKNINTPATHIAFFLKSGNFQEANKARNFLCKERFHTPKLSEFLLENLGVSLNCTE